MNMKVICLWIGKFPDCLVYLPSDNKELETHISSLGWFILLDDII